MVARNHECPGSLATSRITVQDVVPYLQRHCTYEQVREIIPILRAEEFQVIEQYVREHQREVMEQDRRIRERAAARRKPPEEEEAERKGRRERLEQVRQFIRQGKQERNGNLPSR
jgi:hypothetical protein